MVQEQMCLILINHRVTPRYIQSFTGENQNHRVTHSLITTKVYTHILRINSKTLKNPLDALVESATFESE
jgi:hypothetical protein